MTTYTLRISAHIVFVVLFNYSYIKRQHVET